MTLRFLDNKLSFFQELGAHPVRLYLIIGEALNLIIIDTDPTTALLTLEVETVVFKVANIEAKVLGLIVYLLWIELDVGEVEIDHELLNVVHESGADSLDLLYVDLVALISGFV